MITQAPPPDAAGEIVRLVPREPTAAMVEAGGLSDGLVPEEFPGDGATLYPAKVWRAMWDAHTPTNPLRSLSVGEEARRLLAAELGGKCPPDELCGAALRAIEAALSQSNAAQARGFAEGIEAAAKVAGRVEGHRYAGLKIATAIRAQGSGSTDGGAGPVQMLLFCPNCGLKHVDEPDERTPDWTNPPHKSHLCHGCGCIWRPADVPTEGVNAIATIGKADTLDLNSVETLSRQPVPPASGDVGEMVERLRHTKQVLAAGFSPTAECFGSIDEATTLLESLSRNVEVERGREEAFRAAKLCDADHAETCFNAGWDAALQPEQRG